MIPKTTGSVKIENQELESTMMDVYENVGNIIIIISENI